MLVARNQRIHAHNLFVNTTLVILNEPYSVYALQQEILRHFSMMLVFQLLSSKEFLPHKLLTECTEGLSME